MRFSFTLFRYVFIDLLRIFMMASGALSGILSFGGLLRPLTQQGLDAQQVGKMLAYFGPAMTAYSLPIAALFATTVVYGRLSADNEIIAARASGISHLSLAAPAFVMGMLVSLFSLGLLMFVVPKYTLKIEQVVSSNIAQFIAGRINRSHQIRFGQATVFAQQAYLPPQDINNPQLQTVVLESPTIVTFGDKSLDLFIKAATPSALENVTKAVKDAVVKGEARAEIAATGTGTVTASDVAAIKSGERVVVALNVPVEPAALADAQRRQVEIRQYKTDTALLAELKRDRRYRVPKDFHLAQRAVAQIYPDPTGEQYYMMVGLDKGGKFPRQLISAQQGGVESARIGPLSVDSPIKENTKFMDALQLKELYNNLSQSRKIRSIVEEFVGRDQMFRYLHVLRDELNGADRRTTLNADQDWILQRLTDDPAYERSGELFVTLREGAPGFAIRFQSTDQETTTVINAKELKLRATPDPRERAMDVQVELHQPYVQTPEGPTPRKLVSYPLKVPMSEDVAKLADIKVKDYIAGAAPPGGGQQRLTREVVVLTNDILSEIYARISFAFSCLILVMLGCALGVMFRSGNFLSSFAISFIPALLSITLIIAGQRVCGSVPLDYPKHANPLPIGLALIWSGNAFNLLLAMGLWWRLQRE